MSADIAFVVDKGGYIVHPVATPFETYPLINNKVIDGTKNQNLRLFIRGNAISGADSIKGISQFPIPPTMAGIIRKKIINIACEVTRFI